MVIRFSIGSIGMRLVHISIARGAF